jgi:hypothetical protein
MSADQIRSMLKTPFRPFLVRTAVGETYKVAHPGLYGMDPDGEALLVKDRAQGVALIDTASVTGCVRLQSTNPASEG